MDDVISGDKPLTFNDRFADVCIPIALLLSSFLLLLLFILTFGVGTLLFAVMEKVGGVEFVREVEGRLSLFRLGAVVPVGLGVLLLVVICVVEEVSGVVVEIVFLLVRLLSLLLPIIFRVAVAVVMVFVFVSVAFFSLRICRGGFVVGVG